MTKQEILDILHVGIGPGDLQDHMNNNLECCDITLEESEKLIDWIAGEAADEEEEKDVEGVEIDDVWPE